MVALFGWLYLMVNLGRHISPKAIEIPFPITINEIADISGCSRETVGSVIKQLKEDQQLEYERKQFTFLHPSFFKSYSE